MSKQAQVEAFERELKALYESFEADADKIDATDIPLERKTLAGRILRDEFNVARMILAIEWGLCDA